MTSPDGITWSSGTSPATNAWTSICWSSQLELFIAVSNSSFMVSKNGVNWYIRNDNNTNSIKNICWSPSLNIFVICGSNNNSTYAAFGVSNKILDTNVYTPSSTNTILSNLQTVSFSTFLPSITWRSICWSSKLQLFVAVGSSSLIISQDGINWSIQTVPANDWYSVCWSPELSIFVAVSSTGTGNRAITSPDGINWTSRTPAANNNWSSICWSSTLGLFVAISSNGTTSNNIMTSVDGINWISRTSPATSAWSSICWSQELSLFVAVSTTSGANNVMVSSNGTTWSGYASGVGNMKSVCWSPKLGMFMTTCASNNQIYVYSYNGKNWISNSYNLQTTNLYSCTWCDTLGLFIVIGYFSTYSTLSYSFNGLQWYAILNSTNSITLYLNTICWSPDLSIFIALPTSTLSVLIKSQNLKDSLSINLNITNSMSNNMISNYSNNKLLSKYWYTQTSTSNNSWSSIAFSEELCTIVAISSDGTTSNNIMISNDGIIWTSQTSPNTNAWSSVCYSDELVLFVVVASSGTGNRVMTSPDGITWTSRTSAVDNNWTSICYSSNLALFVAVASSGTGNRVMTSSNGIIWTSRNSASNNNWTSVCWSDNLSLFVSVSSSGTGNRVMTSPDGINWTSQNSAVNNNWTSVCWSSTLGLFVAVASDGTTSNQIMTSIDGINWISRSSPIANSWNSICWSFDLKVFMAVASSGTGNRVMTSSDGINWNTQSSASDNNWKSIIWCNSLSIFVSVSSSGTGNRIMISNVCLPTYKTVISPNNPYQLYMLNTGVSASLGPSYQINSRVYNNTLPSLLSINTSSTYNNGCFRLTNNLSNSNYVDFDLNSNATQLNVLVNGSNKIFNIVNHNGNTTGLQLANSVISIQASDFNKLNSIPGTASASKVLISDSSNNISGINTISAKVIYINGKIYLNETANNNSCLSNIIQGTASASKLLVTDSNNSIININNLYTKDLNVNNANIINTKCPSTNLNRALSSFKLYNKYPSNIIPSSMTYASSLGLIVAVGTCWGNADMNAIYNIMYSYDGYNWSAARAPINITLTSICWSQELSLFVAVGNSSFNNISSRALYSSDGINWLNAPSQSYNWSSVCWSSSVGLFVAVNTNISRSIGCMTSPDGVNWTIRDTVSSNSFVSSESFKLIN
jgi:hypothetical protein